MPLNLAQLKRHARNYVEHQARAKVKAVRFSKRFILFGREDVALEVDIEDRDDPTWWVIGGSTPMNLYSKKAFPDVGMAFTLHTGLTAQILDRDFKQSSRPPKQVGYDAFICHASEDKKSIVKPLAIELTRMGFRVWYDEFELRVGDSLRRSIDRGLASSQHGVVILSRSFFRKNWPQLELDGLVAREVAGQSAILPVWHGVTRNQVLSYSPTLADRVSVSTSRKSVRAVAAALADAMDN